MQRHSAILHRFEYTTPVLYLKFMIYLLENTFLLHVCIPHVTHISPRAKKTYHFTFLLNQICSNLQRLRLYCTVLNTHMQRASTKTWSGVNLWSGALEWSVFWSGFWSRGFGVNLADTDVLPLEIIVHVKDDHLKSA